jgi:hypothetical protein
VPISTAQFTLATGVRQQIVAPHTMSQHVCIHNHEHNQNKEIFIGNSTVTTTTGIHAVATQTSLITIGPGDDLWAISGEDGTVSLHVLVVKQD